MAEQLYVMLESYAVYGAEHEMATLGLFRSL
jgi:hypothetical protein